MTSESAIGGNLRRAPGRHRRDARDGLASGSDSATVDRAQSWACWVLALGGGLLVGALTSFGQGWLERPFQALVNSAGAWLVIAFIAGAFARNWRLAATAGAVACLAELLGYAVTAHLRGYAAGGSIVLFWCACGIVGGPLLGAAGYHWRHGRRPYRALAVAVAAGVFIAEGLWVYVHQTQYYGTAAVWFAIAAAILLVLPARQRAWAPAAAWLAVTVPLGLVAEAILTLVYNQSF
jgi:MFS family permease